MRKLYATVVIIIFAVAGLWSSSTGPLPGWATFVAKEGNHWAFHFSDHNTLTAIYGLGRSRSASPEEAATKFLQQNSRLMDIQNLSTLRLEQTEHSALGTLFRYRQHYAGLPVVSAEINVQVNQRNQIIAANSQYYSLASPVEMPCPASRAAITAMRFLHGEGTVADAQLMVFALGSEPRPVWRYEAVAHDGRSWLLYIDAINPHVILRTAKTFVEFEGQGNVWAENPVVTPARALLRFPHMDATRALSGQYLRVYDANFKQSIVDIVGLPTVQLSKFTTAKSPNRKYNYDENDARLSEAMAFYHINRVHDRWQSLGFQGLNIRAPVFVNVAAAFGGGAGWDNAQYFRAPQFPKTGVFLFGSGQVFHNFGLDGDVYSHEYGHGVLDHVAPGLLEAVESVYPAAFHEAFGDISACALSGNSRMGEYASLNRQTGKWEGRNLDNNNRYPAQVADPETHIAEPHHTGLIAGGAWWDLQKQIGIPKAQAILFHALGLLPSEMNFFDIRDAMIAADQSLNAGANTAAITAAFAKHGITGANQGQKGRIQFKGLLVTGGSPNQNEQIKNTFQRGDLIYLVAQYDGAGLSPGYNLVPVNFSFQQPSGGDVFAFPLISEVRSGSHRGLKGVHLFEVDTDQNTKPGTYTFVLAARLGGTSQSFPQASVSFTLN